MSSASPYPSESTISQLKNSEIPFVLSNHEGIITDVNSHFELVFGWSKAEIIGRSLTTILPAIFHDSHNLSFSRFSATGNSTLLNHPLKLKAITKEGKEIESEHFIVAERQDNKWIFGATLKPL
jgi:PAS domain S-box-containing protein